MFVLLKTVQPNILASEGPALYSLFAAKPRVLGTATQSVKSESSTTEVIRQFMVRYNADDSLIEHANKFKEEAENYNISPWLVVSIGMCEGNLGRATPKFKGQETYNTWGWAASEKDLAEETGTYNLNSWENAIGTVTEGLATASFYKRYTSKPILSFGDIENIMRFYSPSSILKGSPWAKCVWQYYNELENFKSTL